MDFSAPMGGLFGEPRAAVLAVLLRSGEPLTGRQVYERVAPRWSLRAVQNALAGLERLGVTEQRVAGRAIIHTLNRAHYVVPHLEGLLSPLAALRHVAEEFLGGLSARGGAQPEAVWLFGSVATGEATPNSDVDLALIVPTGDWEAAAAQLCDLVRRSIGNECDAVIVDVARLTLPPDPGDSLVAVLRRDAITLAGRALAEVTAARARPA